MVSRRPLAERDTLDHLFPGEQLQMGRAAIRAGNTDGRSAFLWDQGNDVFYLPGGADLSGTLECVWLRRPGFGWSKKRYSGRASCRSPNPRPRRGVHCVLLPVAPAACCAVPGT